jgi:hypothetical protein
VARHAGACIAVRTMRRDHDVAALACDPEISRTATEPTPPLAGSDALSLIGLTLIGLTLVGLTPIGLTPIGLGRLRHILDAGCCQIMLGSPSWARGMSNQAALRKEMM